MNINKWMCKRYDNKNKGYVEINDILLDIFRISVLLSWSILFLNGVRLFIFPSNNYNITNPVLATPFEVLSMGCCIASCIFIIGVLMFIIFFCICTTKIVDCKKR